MKALIAATFCLSSILSMSALAMPQDYFFSIYGTAAQKRFENLPKINSNCAYAQNEVDANGNLVDSLKLVIQGQQINSVLCRQLGEQTYACEASTLWNDGACKTN